MLSVLKMLNFFSISKRYIMNFILGIIKKTQRLDLKNIVTLQFCNRCFYSKTKIDRVLLRLRILASSMSYLCKTETTHNAGVASS